MSRAKSYSRERQKQWEQKRRQSRSSPVGSELPKPKAGTKEDANSWPIVRAYVPVDDVFRATGFGSAGIVRLRPNGKWITAFFSFSLLDGGLTVMCGKDETDEVDFKRFLELYEKDMPALEPGPPELAARYIWGAHEMGLSAGNKFDRKMASRYLGMVPPLAGSRSSWLQQFIGAQGLAAPGLVRYLRDHPAPDDIPEDKEVMVWTTATFACKDTNRVRDELRKLSPEFENRGEGDDGADFFNWTRKYPRNHWSPLSLMGGRQVLGAVSVHEDHVIAEAKVLSMASILIAKLKRSFGDDIRLTDTQWKGFEELIRDSRASRDADS